MGGVTASGEAGGEALEAQARGKAVEDDAVAMGRAVNFKMQG